MGLSCRSVRPPRTGKSSCGFPRRRAGGGFRSPRGTVTVHSTEESTAMPIYMKYGDVKGNVTSGDHKDWIELTSCQFGTGRPMTMSSGGATNREAGATPNVSEIVCSKVND